MSARDHLEMLQFAVDCLKQITACNTLEILERRKLRDMASSRFEKALPDDELAALIVEREAAWVRANGRD